MKALSYINKRNYQLQLEKLIIGVEEPIFIKGIGNVLAKADSGNSAFNVLHGEDFYYQGGTVVFTTFDEEGKQHRVSKKVQSMVTINIGAGHTEERPVVLMDVKFANDEYLNVPFTVGNRANNKNKVLLGKEFLTKELDVLIDVSQDNISDKNIEIDVPISEDSNQEQGENNIIDSRRSTNPSGASTTARKVLQGIKGASYGLFKAADLFTNPHMSWGEIKSHWNKMKEIINNFQRSDKELIFKYLSEQFMQSKQPMDSVFNNPQVIKLIDYLGNDYAGNNNLNLNSPEKTEDTPYEQKEFQVAEAVETAPSTQQNTKAFAKIKKAVDDELKTIVYLVLYNGDQLEQAKQILSAEYPNFTGEFNELINSASEFSLTSFTTEVAKNIIEKLKANNISGAVISCSGVNASRKVSSLTDLFEFASPVEKEETSESETVEEPVSQEETIEYNPEKEDVFGNELSEQVFDYKSVDDQMLREFFLKNGANPDLVYSYTLFAYTDKAKAYEYKAKDNNIRKNVILYYYVSSNIKPDSIKIGKEFEALKEIIKNIIQLFDIDSISEGVKHYITRFIGDMRENGCLGVCFGDFMDRSGFFLNGNTTQEDVKNPKLITVEQPEETSESETVEEPVSQEEINDDKKALKAKQRKAASGKRARAWKSVINTLPESVNDFSDADFDKMYFAINKITSGDNNFRVPLPINFAFSAKKDPKIKFITRKGNNKIIKRIGRNKRLMTYNVIEQKGKLYISLVSSKEIGSTEKPVSQKQGEQPEANKEKEATEQKPVKAPEVKQKVKPAEIKEKPQPEPKLEVPAKTEKVQKTEPSKLKKKLIDAEIIEPVKEQPKENKKLSKSAQILSNSRNQTLNIQGNRFKMPKRL